MNRRRFIGVAAVFLFLFNGYNIHAQITNIKLSDSLDVTRIYGGINSRFLIPIDTINPSSNMTFRVGAEVVLDLNKTFGFKALGVLQVNSNRPTNSIATFEVISRLHQKVQLNIGFLPGPVTKLRPNPVSWQSQTELYAQSRLVGAKPGAVLTFEVTEELLMSYGILEQEGFITSQARLNWDKLSLVGFYREDDEYLIAFDYTNTSFKIITNYASQFEELALGVFVPLSKKWTSYIDTNFLFNEEEMTIGALGLRRYFGRKETPLAGFFTLEYEVKSKNVFTQLIVHLD